ncbi:MAG: prolyl oligopeptidase family serine peptidase [Prevotella sp.]|nr:prolyl oligopeptidase family serine peptidase [Prevotella sp.]
MKQTLLTLVASMAVLSTLQAQVRTQVREFSQSGPYAVVMPFSADSVDVSGQKFDEMSLLNAIPLESQQLTTCKAGLLPSLAQQKSVGVLSFYLNNADYVKGKIEVKGPQKYRLYIDGQESSGNLDLWPEHHLVAIKYLAQPSDTDSISVSIDASRAVSTTLDKHHPYMVHDLTDGHRVRGISVSADGQYVCVSYQDTERGGNSRWRYELLQLTSQGTTFVRTLPASATWMPRTCAYIEEVTEGSNRMLYKVDARTGERTRWISNLPKGSYTISPTEDFLIVTAEAEGPKEDRDVFQVLEMDDRQPGWRNRNYLMKYDVATGICQRITYGTKGEHLFDISQDGQKLLFGTSYSRLTSRPTEVMDVFTMDVRTLQVDTLLLCEGFLGSCAFSPDATQVLFMGTPEAFNRIGCQLPDHVTPSMTENELFLFDLSTRKTTPLTRDFDPSVQSMQWSAADGKIYFSAEDRDYVSLFRLHPQTATIEKLPQQGDYTYRWAMADQAPVMAYLSYKTLEPASAYVVNIPQLMKKKGKKSSSSYKDSGEAQLFDGRTALGQAQVGTCEDWNYKNSHGDTVYGRLYLPADFDASKKYPMIVYYYGGCSPTSRYFESPYAPQMWNSLGYVAYIVEPSGATGFGQEWASRHVNTAGGAPVNGVVPGGTPAGDIIEGVKKICEEHPFINPKKIGCMGASYGGFMTQYLQTVTDIFACAVSHAGIANHTSYWGEGYWGYNYSEVSMANSYPWSHRQLYVDQSPLFNADKIHTPLLLLHGNADTNVPLIESLQMFTALKLLGREVALVEVEGQNHHILDYGKREKWLATQMAWFQRWLKDDPSWWDALYPKKHL